MTASSRTFRFALHSFLAARLLLTLAGVAFLWGEIPYRFAASGVYEYQALVVPDWGGAGAWLIDPWYRWDTGWFMKIAALGYSPDDGSVIYQPLYPWLVRLIQPLMGGHYLLAGLVVSNLCALLAIWLFLGLASRHLGSELAGRRALLFWLAFPTAFFLLAAYSESLFLALTLGSLRLAEDRRWALAGLLAALAVLALWGWAD